MTTGRSFHHRHRVTYSECTIGNHVYYARYLDLLEEARGEMMRSIGMSLVELQAAGFAFPVLDCRISYRHAARYDDVLDIGVWLTQVERVRLRFAYRITNQAERVVVEAETLHVATNLEEKPRRLPEAMAARLREFLAAGPEGTIPQGGGISGS